MAKTETSLLNYSGIIFLLGNLRYTIHVQKKFYFQYKIVINSGRSEVIWDYTLGNLTMKVAICIFNDLQEFGPNKYVIDNSYRFFSYVWLHYLWNLFYLVFSWNSHILWICIHTHTRITYIICRRGKKGRNVGSILFP